jgi:hypothetical protein
MDKGVVARPPVVFQAMTLALRPAPWDYSRAKSFPLSLFILGANFRFWLWLFERASLSAKGQACAGKDAFCLEKHGIRLRT